MNYFTKKKPTPKEAAKAAHRETKREVRVSSLPTIHGDKIIPFQKQAIHLSVSPIQSLD